MPSFEHIPRIKSVHQQEPPEHLNLWDTFRFPQPAKRRMNRGSSEVEPMVRIVC